MSRVRCQQCGTEYAKSALGGLCPRCVQSNLLSQPSAECGTREAERLQVSSCENPNPTQASQPDRTRNSECLGPYELVEKLGEGGCGVVYAAEQSTPLRRRVALKIIKLGMDTRAVVARFEAERQALARMDHPNIARIFDAGATASGRPYFVMELVSGIRITDFCDLHKLTIQARIQLFISVCKAVQHAHQKGIVHRDLKPSNILVANQEGVPVPKIIDFGIAKAIWQSPAEGTVVTEWHQFLGTPEYTSPEQSAMSGLDVDTRADIYSLGVVLYKLLTGSTPFEQRQLRSGGLDALRHTLCDLEAPKPSLCLHRLLPDKSESVANARGTVPVALCAALRGDLDWIVMKCLERDRSRRYETANGLAADLRRHLNNEPVTAAAPGAGYLFDKFVRRHKRAMAAAAIVGVTLVAATAVSGWLAVRATRAQSEASRRLHESEAFAKFLTEVFQSPDPARDGRSVTVAETLGRAVKKMETELAQQPARRVRLQAAVAATYHALGLYNDAIPLEETVLKYNRDTLGPGHPEALDAAQNLALSYDEAGRAEAARDLRAAALESSQRVNGPEHPQTIRAMIYLGWSLNKLGPREKATTLQEQALALSSRLNGPEHADTILAMSYLGWTYTTAGAHQKALQLQEQVLSLMLKRLGPDHPDTLNAMTSLAVTYSKTGQIEEAIQMQRRVVEISRKIKGANHPETMWATANLGTALARAGCADEAIPIYAALLVESGKVNGPDHGRTIECLRQLLDAYLDEERYDEAGSLLEAEKASAPSDGKASAGRWVVHQEARAELYCRKKDFAAAEQAFRDLIQYFSDNKRPAMTPDPTFGLANVFCEWAWTERTTDPLRAAEHARAAADMASSFEKSAVFANSYVRSLVGSAVSIAALTDLTLPSDERDHRLAKAESLLRSAQEALDKDASASRATRHKNLERLSRLYEAWNKSSQLSGIQAQLESFHRRNHFSRNEPHP